MKDSELNIGIYDDFPGYRIPSKEELDEALRTALVVVDTNVLLNLYLYNDLTRQDLLDLFRRLGDRLWVPSQVVREFWRSRIRVLTTRGRQVNEALTTLKKQRQGTLDTIERWAQATAIDSDSVKRLTSKVDTLYATLEENIQAKSPALQPGSSIASDQILHEIESLLRGRVGKAPSRDEMDAAIQDGRDRIARGQPPGSTDIDKEESGLPEGGTGDYLVWIQAISEVERRRDLNLLLITDEKKADWWWKYRSEFLGPSIQLAAELRERCDRQLYMMRPTDLLQHASSALSLVVHDKSVDDAERVSRQGALDSAYGRDDATWHELVEGGLEYLIEVAGRGKMTSHVEFNQVLTSRTGRGFDFRIPEDRQAMGYLLTRIVQRNFPETKLIISALVPHRDSGEPGDGFYSLARELGLVKGRTTANMRLEFWLGQVKALHQYGQATRLMFSRWLFS
jgi:hypothetical protein